MTGDYFVPYCSLSIKERFLLPPGNAACNTHLWAGRRTYPRDSGIAAQQLSLWDSPQCAVNRMNEDEVSALFFQLVQSCF